VLSALHSVFVVGSVEGVLLVRSRKSLAYYVKVSNQPTLLDLYDIAMDYIYNNRVKPFY
jgi:hypothetical protein